VLQVPGSRIDRRFGSYIFLLGQEQMPGVPHIHVDRESFSFFSQTPAELVPYFMNTREVTHLGKKKKSTREKAANRSAKPRFTLRANLFHRDVVAPLVRAWRMALANKNYDEAGRLYEEILKAKREHRIWLHRKEMVRIR
jgi:hypothetical protein